MSQNKTVPLIAVVDDDADAAFLVRRLLHKCGIEHSTVHLGDGERAMQYLEALSAGDAAQARPALMILDIKMPRVSGFDLLEWMRSRGINHLPVVVMTTSDDPRDKERARELGADEFVSKFPEPSAMRAIIERLIN